mmetsp:Transcript_34359/g.34933  ORF Transcript_34359/g.34933 Transcript_34359/m.34933 type:complete len:97 (-) Transcript_34359:248-538(-)
MKKKETVSDEEEEKAMTTTTTTTSKVVAPTKEVKDRSLSFSRLTGTITHAKYKLKTNKIILTLTKEKGRVSNDRQSMIKGTTPADHNKIVSLTRSL